MQAKVPFIDRIWRVSGELALEDISSPREAFARLDPLFKAQDTTISVDGDTLTYVKKNPAAQDKLATFTSGHLHYDAGNSADSGARITWDLGSTALFLTFLAPFAFLAFGQLTVLINEFEKPAVLEKMAEREREKEEEKAKGEAIELHWFDQMMGVPQPGSPDEEKAEEEARGEAVREDAEDEEIDYNHSPETAYVLAGIFAVIFLVGRVLEPWLIKRTFRAALTSPDTRRDDREPFEPGTIKPTGELS